VASAQISGKSGFSALIRVPQREKGFGFLRAGYKLRRVLLYREIVISTPLIAYLGGGNTPQVYLL